MNTIDVPASAEVEEYARMQELLGWVPATVEPKPRSAPTWATVLVVLGSLVLVGVGAFIATVGLMAKGLL